MRLLRSKVILSYVGIGLLLASVAYVALNHHWRAVDDRVYVIGWNNSPPFQERGTDGSPAGLVINLVENVARRRGIRLKWAWHPEGPDAALRKRDVDLWPLMTITPERQRVNHISKPYLQHDYDLLVRASSGYSRSEDLSAASITYIWMPLHQRFLKRLLPNARLIPVASGEQAIKNVCGAHRRCLPGRIHRKYHLAQWRRLHGSVAARDLGSNAADRARRRLDSAG